METYEGPYWTKIIFFNLSARFCQIWQNLVESGKISHILADFTRSCQILLHSSCQIFYSVSRFCQILQNLDFWAPDLARSGIFRLKLKLKVHYCLLHVTWHSHISFLISGSFSKCHYSPNSAWIPLKFKIWLSEYSILMLATT